MAAVVNKQPRGTEVPVLRSALHSPALPTTCTKFEKIKICGVRSQ